MKLTKAIEAFIDDVRVRRSEATAVAYESDLQRFKFYVPMDTVLHVTPQTIRAFIAANSADGKAMSTLHRRIACLRTFCRWGVKHGIWVTSPADAVEQIRRPKTLPRPFTDDEVAALEALQLDPRETLIRALLLYTGLRVTPICMLKVGDVSFAPPTLRALVKGARTQIVKLHPGLVALLRTYISGQTDGRAQTLLFALRDGHVPERRDIERMTLRWGQRAGVINCTPHRWRHTFGTNLYRKTRDLRLVQKAMGHVDIASTTIYTFLSDEDEAEAIAKLNWGAGLCAEVMRTDTRADSGDPQPPETT